MLVTKNLKAYYRFEGNANDNSGNGHNGTVVGATLATGKFGRCYSFDGSDDYISVGDHADLRLAGALTIATWVYLKDKK